MTIITRDNVEAADLGSPMRNRYWHAQARKIFVADVYITRIEIIRRKTESEFVRTRGRKYPPADVYVIIPSTSGKWGKSRRDYRPHNYPRTAPHEHSILDSMP